MISDVNKKVKNWFLAIRPKTLTASLAPVLAGSALAFRDGKFHFLPAIAALAGALLLQIGSNVANDLFDYLKGIDSDERQGPVRAAQAGLLSVRELKSGLYVIFGFALLAGIYLSCIGGWPIMLIGIMAIISAIAYTAGPYPLGYHGWGDLFVLAFFGFAATMGTYYVQTNTIGLVPFIVSFSIGLLIVNILVVNNYRDFDSDYAKGKRTLAVIIGKKWTKFEYIANFVIAFMLVGMLIASGKLTIICLIVFLLVPRAIKLTKELNQNTGPFLNQVLAKTGMFAFVFSLLLSIGILL